MEFVKPSFEYLDSYLKVQESLEKEGSMTFKNSVQEIKKDKEKFISESKILETKRLNENNNSIIPAVIYWLVDEETKDVMGFVKIRYELNENLLREGGHIGYAVAPQYRLRGFGKKLLEKGLEVAKEFWLGEILITCNANNVGSKKIIETQGGQLINSVSIRDELKLRYRIVLNPSAHNMWNKFLKLSTDENLKKNEFQHTCFQFGVAPDELGKLVFDGIKRARTSLVLAYENEMAEYPKVGAYSIVLNSKNEALCIVKIIKTSIKKFSDVDENYAFLEGEGDKSLSYWQRVHREFFGDYLKKLNKEFSDDMEVFMEEYEVVYK